MPNVPIESGPNGIDPFLHPERLLAAAGYPIAAPLHPAIQQAVSTGRAIAGIAGTAMGQLANTQNGIPQQMVIFDLTRSR
jgi:hypothetical protein